MPKPADPHGAAAGPPKSSIQKTLLVLSILCATSSVVSLVSRYLEIGISPIFGDFLEYYRRIAISIVTPILGLFQLPTPPAYYFDLWPLSFLAATAHAWAYSEYPEPPEIHRFLRFFVYTMPGRILLGLATGLTMTGLFVILVVGGTELARLLMTKNAWRLMTEGDLELQHQMQASRRMRDYFGIVGAASVLFFAINAYAPGLE